MFRCAHCKEDYDKEEACENPADCCSCLCGNCRWEFETKNFKQKPTKEKKMKYPDYPEIPEHMQETIWRYVNDRVPMGGFLEAVFSNDLMESFGKADDYNISIMFIYAKLVHNDVPYNCHGSKKIYDNWLKGEKDG